MNNKVHLIDCTLRDGGYYNNWNFSKSFIQKYLNTISKTEIKNVEIGFLTIPENRNKGLTANCNKLFFKRLIIPKNVNCGIMINGADFLNNQLNESKIYKNLEDIPIKSVKFIRFACQIYEISKIKTGLAVWILISAEKWFFARNRVILGNLRKVWLKSKKLVLYLSISYHL